MLTFNLEYGIFISRKGVAHRRAEGEIKMLKYQQHLVSKKWSEMTQLEKIAETELNYFQNYELGYWTKEQFEKELQDKINTILAN